jgi:rubrerythrin
MRAIDADAMIDRLKEWDTKDKIDKALYNFTLNRINEQPTIQPAQPDRIKGRWTVKEGELSFWDVCSVCRKMIIHRAPHYNFCPNCGADMREVTT